VQGLPASELLGWAEGASLYPDDSRDLAAMVTRLPDFIPPAGRSPPWDVLRRRNANGRWARTRRLCGILALVGPDDGGDPRTGGTLVGLQVETPLPPAGAPDPVSAARRSALAAAAFSACEVLMTELRREWEAGTAEGPPAGGACCDGDFDGAMSALQNSAGLCCNKFDAKNAADAADNAAALGVPASGGPPSRGSSGSSLHGPPSRGSSGSALGGRDTVSWLNDVILGGVLAMAKEEEAKAAVAAAGAAKDASSPE
jgi:hypothetical protein